MKVKLSCLLLMLCFVLLAVTATPPAVTASCTGETCGCPVQFQDCLEGCEDMTCEFLCRRALYLCEFCCCCVGPCPDRCYQ